MPATNTVTESGNCAWSLASNAMNICQGPVPARAEALQGCAARSGSDVMFEIVNVVSFVLKKTAVTNSGDSTPGASVILTPATPLTVVLVIVAVRYGDGELGVAPVTIES